MVIQLRYVGNEEEHPGHGATTDAVAEGDSSLISAREEVPKHGSIEVSLFLSVAGVKGGLGEFLATMIALILLDIASIGFPVAEAISDDPTGLRTLEIE